jgi:hypothetical protein
MIISSFANEESYKELFFLNLVVLALAYKFLCTGREGANRSLCPGCPMGKDRPWSQLSKLHTGLHLRHLTNPTQYFLIVYVSNAVDVRTLRNTLRVTVN